jgi:hypothetical protein
MRRARERPGTYSGDRWTARPLFSSRVWGLGASFSPDGQRLRRRDRLSADFDVTPDGQRFLMRLSRGRQHVSLILNGPDELARIESAGASR